MIGRPNFLVIGAARSGSTLLHQYFLQHPEIFVPQSKQPEPHFFLKTSLYERGVEWYHSTFFSNVKNEKAIGEISTSHMYGEHVPERMYKYNPNLRFIVLLRNPVQRAFSNYWHSRKNGLEKISFDEAIQNETERLNALNTTMKEIAPFAYIGRSLYSEQFKRFFKYFDREQFHVTLFEELIENPKNELVKMLKFLGVNPDFEFKMVNSQLNKSRPENAQISAESEVFLTKLFEVGNNELQELFNLNLAKWK